jgi:cysteine-rich CWC protein
VIGSRLSGGHSMFSKEKHCSRCGESFECGGLFGCWCRSVKVDAATLAEMRGKYADCLCPRCLQALARRPVDEPAAVKAQSGN